MNEHKRYLVRVAVFFALFSASIVAANIIVDPYFIFDRPGNAGFNDTRVEAIRYPHVVKTYALTNQAPRTLIFGSSRAQIGLNPEHKGFSIKPVYNAGMGGTSMFALFRYFQHAVATTKPQQVILALDFFQFDTREPMSLPEQERLAVTFDGQPTPRLANWRQQLLDLRFATLSANAVAASWRTIYESGGHDRTMKWVALANGQNVLLHRPPSLSPGASYATERSFLRNMWSPRFCVTAPDTGHSQLNVFRQFIRLAHKHEIDLRIFISPAHARLWETIEQAGLWEKWENWKRNLTMIVLDEAGRNSPFPLWDFSGYNVFSTDTLETARWFIDTNHYTTEAGDLILDVVLGVPSARREMYSDYGTRLTRDTVETHLAHVREGREKWRAASPVNVEQIKALADEIPGIKANNASCD